MPNFFGQTNTQMFWKDKVARILLFFSRFPASEAGGGDLGASASASAAGREAPLHSAVQADKADMVRAKKTIFHTLM